VLYTDFQKRKAESRKLVLSRTRSNTAHSYSERFNPIEERPPSPPTRPIIPKASRADSIRSDLPRISRTNSLRQDTSRPDSPASPYNRYADEGRSYSPDSSSGKSYDASPVFARTPLRPLARGDTSGSLSGIGIKKGPPPPPPSRAKKPPPPPPMKRASYSTSQIPSSPHY